MVLETVAAMPGMVGATITHLTCLRRMVDDDDWIRTVTDEAENERMHMMTLVEIARPTAFKRLVVLLAQQAFYIDCFGLCLASRRMARRLVGHFEGKAVLSYTLCLDEPESGRMPNPRAPGWPTLCSRWPRLRAGLGDFNSSTTEPAAGVCRTRA